MGDAVVGIIGMGDMGKMYARRISKAGWRVLACDLPAKTAALEAEFSDNNNVSILKDGYEVSRASDWIMYFVEAKNIHTIVADYGRSTKMNAIVGGQTSTKAPEIAAFERYLPADVDIISCHSLHGPGVDPKGQPLVIINHRVQRQESADLVKRILSCMESNIVHLSAEEHDRITADTQAVTHAAFLSMGSAWHANKQFPWEIPRYVGGIENVKINLMMRIYSNKWHVYAGLAILNPAAKIQIKQYSDSVTHIYALMLQKGKRDELTKRIYDARDKVFGQPRNDDEGLLLQDDLLDRFSLGKKPAVRHPNNHLSLLAMVDCWSELNINPYEHMICSTPLFRLWLGITEYVFRKPGLLDECIDTAMENDSFRSDDLKFTLAANAWSDVVRSGNMEAYREKFEEVQKYFESSFAEATKVGNEMIKTIEVGLRSRKTT
ncbi:prephenate dehydrogenase (NADP(+)) [Elasticomyces elasticus]|nr:prephenate dehydrogenase (NADP(+)) [Elasticomyces elasticus]KAK4966584.1 prephenate dehydrogenase (NADP(+)) [Elasticomyces elasticus]